jgi:exonuclease I
MHVVELTEAWLQTHFHDVIRQTAQRVGLKNLEWKSSLEQLQEIEAIRPTVNEKLREFFVVYERWFSATKDFNQKLLDGTLTQQDKAQAIDCTVERDAARQALIKEIGVD